MSRNFLDSVQALYKQLMSGVSGDSAPVEERVKSARMSHTRLKALERPDYLSNAKSDSDRSDSLAATFQCASRPSASHYRLQAFIAKAEPEQPMDMIAQDDDDARKVVVV